ncbi:SPOR domain-containing protein [Sphingomonas sp. PL-96]|uniref:SPOR domain-containing protein n=1 Tax=Sphingomonas sp. PL-96 TaxID=2887201 RepID=UPI001E3D1B64|nr:SPOR domain-containing protein [Sphingomonas sp. PL-96]MCC2976055.1 SPOR domain-containing protein [Sphingomonas sp. PL-96]
MKSHGSAVAAVLLAGCSTGSLPPAPAEPAIGSLDAAAPRASATLEARYDAVGWAGAAAPGGGDTGVFVTHPSLPAGSFVELTLLESGRTTVFKVARQGAVAPGYLLTLSPVAAQALGVGTQAVPMRVRQVLPALHEQAAAEGGSLARMDAPQVLLAALRKRLPPAPVGDGATAPAASASEEQAPPPAGARPIQTVALPPTTVSPLPPAPVTHVPTPAAPVAPRRTGGWVVQVAALSNLGRAEALAHALGGFTDRAGTLVRVRTGPYSSVAGAEQGRAKAAARGYGDAKVLRND